MKNIEKILYMTIVLTAFIICSYAIIGLIVCVSELIKCFIDYLI